jgi:hypothetical protein
MDPGEPDRGCSPGSAARLRVQQDIIKRQRVFGFTDEEIRVIITPMASSGEEPVGSMGTDTPPACLSDRPQPLFNYFRQLFAQVTNPPIDSIRESQVMSLTSYIGTERNILDESPVNCHTLKLQDPILTNRDLEKLRRVSQGDFLATMLPTLFRVDGGEKELTRALDGLCRRASLAIQSGYSIIILSVRIRRVCTHSACSPGGDPTTSSGRDYAELPSLLNRSAVRSCISVHQLRCKCSESVSRHDHRHLVGLGVLPEGWTLRRRGQLKAATRPAEAMSKMGISTCKATAALRCSRPQAGNVIEAVLHRHCILVGGVGLDVIAQEAKMKHEFGFRDVLEYEPELDLGGEYAFRMYGERHLINPLTIPKLHQAVRHADVRSSGISNARPEPGSVELPGTG